MEEKKYKIVEDYIIKNIKEKNFKAGEQIPTEDELCRKFGFSRMTVNKALNHLS